MSKINEKPTKTYQVNYLKLINFFWQVAPFMEGYKASHATLFFAIVDSINRNRWLPVSLPLDYILNKIGCCRKAYTDSRNWLVLNQILDVTPGKNANQMALFQLGAAVHIWTTTDTGMDTGTDTSNSDLPVHKRTGTGTHYKTVNSTKHKTLNIGHEKFFELYGRNTAERKCIKLWEALTDEEREKAAIHIPEYILKTDEEYIMNPKRYLEEKHFNSPVIDRRKKTSNYNSQTFGIKDESDFIPQKYSTTAA